MGHHVVSCLHDEVSLVESVHKGELIADLLDKAHFVKTLVEDLPFAGVGQDFINFLQSQLASGLSANP